MVVSCQTMPVTSYQLDTSELVELLQQSAVEHLTAFRQLEAQEFSSAEFSVCDYHNRLRGVLRVQMWRVSACFRLSTQSIRTLIGGKETSYVFTYPEFIQLMDDDIVSLIALTLIVNPSCRDIPRHASVRQSYLSLYLMTQCQMKLHHSLTSLAQTLDYVEIARRLLREACTFNQLLLKLTERRIHQQTVRIAMILWRDCEVVNFDVYNKEVLSFIRRL